jgi:hypothetical protein
LLKDLYLEAWRLGLKALATFRPNEIREAVLSADEADREPESAMRDPQCCSPELRRIDGCNYCGKCGCDGECG